jgi:mannose-6-phosphate isomerase-like protein (cupin superfamily)
VSGAIVMALEDLPESAGFSREFIGEDHGGTGISMIFVDAAPGRGPSLHKHDYAEVFIVQQGTGTFRVNDDEVEIGAGQLVVVPGGVPHGFKNTGDGPLRQIDIHLNPRFVTEWLDEG